MAMSFEEKSAWIMGVVAAGSYAVYLAIVLGLAGTVSLAEIPYVAPLLWTIGASIGVSIALHALIGIFSPREAGRKDQRDREITASESTSASRLWSSGEWPRC
ncbi:hypothetical protein QFZ30_003697 [Arthrobacter pascens]|uniref:hypothetical protein n=1 Tax=Arthrobacter pascens TaxID=1677 RepID=UPI0027938A82|nr:hypothetical protein [Arthrobacter pascens]MDQ0680315.1 hypothetical protein [Arthrobacter pascens]